MMGRRHPQPSVPAARPGSVASRVSGRRVLRLSNLDTAERLFVQHGALASANRRFGSDDDMGNGIGTVSGHHFGTKADLVRAITHRFTVDVEPTRARLLAGMDESSGIRDWLGCLLYPWTDHFAQRGTTYFARVCAQAMADPTLKAIIVEEARQSPTLRDTCDALKERLPPMPEETAAQREDIVSQVIVHMCAERETAVAAGAPGTPAGWRSMAVGIIDVVAGIWTAPRTPVSHADGVGRRT